MDARRLIQLEREVSQLKADLRSLRVPSGYASRRQPRVGQTVANAAASPVYPTAPDPPTTDPVTGIVTPGDPHPNTFPFVFVDAQYDEDAGIITPTSESRQNTAIGFGQTYHGHIHNLAGVYIPVSTLIEVFEDNGYYWTNWNGSTTGSSSVSSTRTLQSFWLGKSQADDPLAYPTPVLLDPVTWVAYPSAGDDYAGMGLEKSGANDKLTALEDDVTLLIYGSMRLLCTDLSSGDQIDLTVKLRRKNSAGTTLETMLNRTISITVDHADHTSSFVVPCQLDETQYFDGYIKADPSSTVSVAGFGYTVHLGVANMYYLKPTATTS
jgi:hypothetical protein